MLDKRRLHQRPNSGEVSACKWWLEAERSLVRPRLIVALGATAAESLTGSGKGILARRGRLEETTDGAPVFLTIHPSFLLRLRDRQEKAEERARFEDELRTAARHLERLRAVGFDDRGILQINLIAAWFNYINRVADGLGVGRDG